MKNLNAILLFLIFNISLPNCSSISKSTSGKQAKNNDAVRNRLPLNEIIIPFQLGNELILVKAEIDEQIGYFIFDTGVKSILLNNKYFTGRSNNSIHLSGHNNDDISFKSARVSFNWLNDRKEKKEALIIEMNGIENLLEKRILGFVGYSLIKNKEVVFDYQHQEITLYELDKNGARISDSSKHPVASDTIPLYPNNHLAYLNVQIANQNYKLAIDSGTTMNLFQSGIPAKMRNHFNKRGTLNSMNFDGKIEVVESGTIPRMVSSGINWDNTHYIECNIDHFNKDLSTPLDGLLGYEFLKAYKIAINYKKNELYIWQSSHLESFTDLQKLP